jgi:hypothetical protein
MATWVGAIVETLGRADFSKIVADHRIAIHGPLTPWVLIETEVKLSSLGLPAFAETLSRELRSSVIGFALQTTASVEQIEHWNDGQLVRKLDYVGDEGGWITQAGKPQEWEREYFFASDESTAEGAKWPLNLGDELTEEERARYHRAKAAGDASSIMDLLTAGSGWGLRRLCGHFGVDPERPAARYTPPPNWKLRIVAIAVAAFLGGMWLLGALSGR